VAAEEPLAVEEEVSTPQSAIMRRLEVLLAAILTCCAAGLAIFMPDLIATGGIESSQDFVTLSPVFFPRLAFGILALICLGYTVNSARQLRPGSFSFGTDEADRYTRAGFMMTVAVFYAFLVAWLGFIPSTMVMTAVVAIFLGITSPLALLPGTIFIPIVIRFIFERLLLIALPRSEIEFIASMEDSLMKFLSSIFLGT
jgi:hypothetical protein